MSSISGRFTWRVDFGRACCTLEAICYRCQLRCLISKASRYRSFSVFLEAEDSVRHGGLGVQPLFSQSRLS